MIQTLLHFLFISLTAASFSGIASTALNHKPEQNMIAIQSVNQPTRIQYIDTQYAADFSNDAILMGASHNVFIGKVLAQTGAKERGIGPETQFSVRVISNIKGNLAGVITVDQQGGMKNNFLYIVQDDNLPTPTSNEDTYMLKPGSTYLLATRYNNKENWYTLNPYPTASKLLNTSPTLTDNELSDLANSDARVQALKAAYPKEVLLEADVTHMNARNSFSSIHAP